MILIYRKASERPLRVLVLANLLPPDDMILSLTAQFSQGMFYVLREKKMKSSDYLYDLLRKHTEEGWYIGKKRYTIGTSKIDGKWKVAVCSCFYNQIGIIGEFYDTSEDAWVAFLSAKYPKMLIKWQEREKACL